MHQREFRFGIVNDTAIDSSVVGSSFVNDTAIACGVDRV